MVCIGHSSLHMRKCRCNLDRNANSCGRYARRVRSGYCFVAYAECIIDTFVYFHGRHRSHSAIPTRKKRDVGPPS